MSVSLLIMPSTLDRVALASLLGLKDRIDWKACAASDEEEKKDATAFKAAFTPFEPAPAS